MKTFLSVVSLLLTIAIQIFSLMELLGKGDHIATLMRWFSSLEPMTEPTGPAHLSWTGIASAFYYGNTAAWYSWTIVSLLGSSLMLLVKALKDFFIWGFDADELLSGVILTFGTFLVLLGTKLSWLFFSYGTLGWFGLGGLTAIVLICLFLFLLSEFWD